MSDAAQELMALRKRAADLYERRQRQISNQRDSITRLAESAGVSDARAFGLELVRLQERLSVAEARLDAVRSFASKADPFTAQELHRLVGACRTVLRVIDGEQVLGIPRGSS